MTQPEGAQPRGALRGRWLTLPLEVMLCALLLVGGALLATFGAFTYIHAHAPQPVRITGYIADYREILINGSYTRNELRLAGDPQTYVLDKGQFHPQLPSQFEQDARIVIWVDRGTTTILAVTLYDVLGLNPATYTTSAYDSPQAALRTSQGEGLVAGGVGLLVALGVLIWLWTRTLRSRRRAQPGKAPAAPDRPAVVPGLTMRSVLAASRPLSPADRAASQAPAPTASAPTASMPPLVASAPPSPAGTYGTGSPAYQPPAPTPRTPTNPPAPAPFTSTPPAAPYPEPQERAVYARDAVDQAPTQPSPALPPIPLKPSASSAAPAHETSQERSTPAAAPPSNVEPFAAFMLPSSAGQAPPPGGPDGQREAAPSVAPSEGVAPETSPPAGEPTPPARPWRIVGEPYLAPRLMPVESSPPPLSEQPPAPPTVSPPEPPDLDEQPTQKTPVPPMPQAARPARPTDPPAGLDEQPTQKTPAMPPERGPGA